VVLNHPALPLAAVARLPAPSLRRPVVLRALAFALLVLALAQPREVGDWITPPPEGRDMVLLIDTSLTMSIRDFRQGDLEVERMTVLKDTLARFIDGRPGDRFGVIVFGSEVATLTPPTFDRAHVVAQIQRIQVGMVGRHRARRRARHGAETGAHAPPAAGHHPGERRRRQQRRHPDAGRIAGGGASGRGGDPCPAVRQRSLRGGARASAWGPAAEPDPQPDLVDLARLSRRPAFFRSPAPTTPRG
jgi:Ca-activated chloride channel homolog